MLDIKHLILGQLQTNCYLLTDTNTTKTLIIDPADEGDFISQTIIDYKLNPVAIILTHAHFDHCLGILPLKLNFHISIILHNKDLFLYKQANNSAKHWTHLSGDPLPPPDILLPHQKANQILQEFKLEVIETPGHTPGSICLYNNSQTPPLLFSGDTLFKDAIGRTDLSYSDTSLMQTSLKKLSKLPKNTIIYPGHDQPTTINQEKPKILQ